jgi:squalene-hopene/tetraprenyl-beta-curcumene cyclase
MRMLVLLLLTLPAFAADWNPRAAADYLDARQKEWFAWPGANANATPCVSCHTGVTYLLARPALRRVLGEADPTPYETGLLDSLRGRLPKRTAKDLFPKAVEPHLSEGAGVESILAAWFLRDSESYDRMWTMQTADGGWPWFNQNLEPWEQPTSAYYGAAVAALAAQAGPSRPEKARLLAYLKGEFAAQPLHHRLMAVWAGAVPESTRKSTLDEMWQKQSPDGAWPLDALGPWKKQEKAVPATGSNAYATAFAAAILQKAGVPATDPRLVRAFDWLKSHQDPKGYWDATSMNKVYAPESMPAGFMRDAATAYAALALSDARLFPTKP